MAILVSLVKILPNIHSGLVSNSNREAAIMDCHLWFAYLKQLCFPGNNDVLHPEFSKTALVLTDLSTFVMTMHSAFHGGSLCTTALCMYKSIWHCALIYKIIPHWPAAHLVYTNLVEGSLDRVEICYA